MDTILNIIQKIQINTTAPEKINTLPTHNKTLISPEHLVIKEYYDTLVLSGGGVKGIMHLGLLYSFHQKKGDDFMKNIKRYYGTSVGSIVCLLLSIGYSPLEIFVELCKSKVNPTDSINIPNFFINFGFCSSASLFTEISNLVFRKFNYIPNMKELYQLTGKELFIVTHNLNENKIVYLHHSTHETLNCIEALRMSCNIPIIFEKILYNDCYYIDGAFSINGNFPVSYACSNNENKFILALKVNKKSREKEWNLMTYLENVAKISTRQNDDDFVCDKMDKISIYINEDKKDWDLTIDTTYKFSLFSIAYNEGVKLLSNVDTEQKQTMQLIDSFLNSPLEDHEETLVEINDTINSTILSEVIKHKSD